MSIHDKHKEVAFEIDIENYFLANGWINGESKNYSKELGLYPEDLLAFIKATQPNAYEKMNKRHGVETDNILLKHVAGEMDKYGSLACLRGEIKYIGSKFKLCQFKPELHNPDLQAGYDANIFRVVRQVYYSTNNTNSIDIVLFLNGIPITTMELKTDFTQNVHDAIAQYKNDRLPKNEPLLTFNRRSLVHFAVSTEEVHMTTKLAGADTFFLPFNLGCEDGSAGNPPNPNGYATAYLWEDVLQKDSLINIIARYIHLEISKKQDHRGIKSKRETLIFPRFHQLDVVQRLLYDSRTNGSGQNYLIQHSAGSGKSNSIAWLAHQLSSLHNVNDESVFNSIIVITDRTVLDNQLQETISSFEHRDGLVVTISREGSNESKSSQLTEALERGAKIIITTIQTFPFVLQAIQQKTTLKDKKYAIIADEAHSSQTGATAKKLKEVLAATQLDEDAEELSAEDVITATLEASGNNTNLSYFAFTATPKSKTLEMFGTLPDPNQPASETNKPRPFHQYSMKQAIEEGFILNVLRGYTTYKLYYRLEHSNLNLDEKVESKRTKVKIARWLNIHPHNITQKIAIICDHFKHKVMPLLDGQAKAMVVTSSRQAAVRYKIAFDKYINDNNLAESMQAIVAFSGKIVVDIEGVEKEYTEANMNLNLKGKDMRKAFDSNDYQVMLVANKFQTGFDQPKLCAMYVDKKLGGVDCVQTLSRLNRIYDGKEQTMILDFVNTADEIKEAFEPYYNSTELENVTDPNIVYKMQNDICSTAIFSQSDVDAYAQIFFTPKLSQRGISSAIKPSSDRYKTRYKAALERISQAKFRLEQPDVGNVNESKNAELELKEANEVKNGLDIFKKNLISFVRMYDFLSQIVEYGDEDLLKLSVFVKGLIANIKTTNDADPIDVSHIALTHYKLQKKSEGVIYLEGDDNKIRGIEGGSPKIRDLEKEYLSEILSQMNTLFEGELTDDDLINYMNTIGDKVIEKTEVVEQIKNNPKEQALMGGFKDAINEAVIESHDVHQRLAKQLLSDEKVMADFTDMLYESVIKKIKVA